MYPFKKVLVCLDLSISDDAVINYSSWLAKAMGTEYINFIHIAKRLEIPEHIKEKFPNLEDPVDDRLKDEIKEKLKNKFEEGVKVHVTVREGNFTDNTLRLAELKKADLIILGKKTASNYQGLNARRIANTCRCSVLLVPDIAVAKAEAILMPINFSKLSAASIKMAQEIRTSQGSKVFLQNIYKVPNGYRYTGKTYDQFASLMKENAREEYDKFMKVNKFSSDDFDLLLTLGDVGNAAEAVFNEVLTHDIDLLIVGSRGRTSVASFILGSTAVGLIRHDLEIPYLILKEKNSAMGFLSAIKEM